VLKSEATLDHIVIGDFNLHYPEWILDRDVHAYSYQLIEVLTTHRLYLLTPLGLPIFKAKLRTRPSTIDLCFTSAALVDNYILINLDRDTDVDLDYCPVRTIISLGTALQPNKEAYN